MNQQVKNKISYPNLILLILGIFIILFSANNIITLSMAKGQKTTVLNTLENEYYVVGKDPTPYQKEVFNQLSDELVKKQRDYNKISELVAKSFVIDFFGWSNKESTYDIGGLQYLKDPKSFNAAAHWEYYQKLDVFNSTYGAGNLPKVKNINATTTETEAYVIDEVSYPTYVVNLDWTYDHRSNLNIADFVNKAIITLIEEDGKVVIVGIQMVDEVEANE